MCRLFGYTGPGPISVDWALARAENSLERQSTRHRDGWGIGYFRGGRPEVRKSTFPAFADRAYGNTLRSVRSTHVIGHLRRATVGDRTLFNNHPFTHGRWLFAHNGTARAFPEARAEVLERVAPDLRRAIRGRTDSEALFHLLLTLARERHGTLDLDVGQMVEPLRRLAAIVRELDGSYDVDGSSGLNVLVSNGRGLLATRRGHDLHLHRPEDARCRVGSSGTAVEIPSGGAAVASERLSSERSWEAVPEESLVHVTPEARVRVMPLTPN